MRNEKFDDDDDDDDDNNNNNNNNNNNTDAAKPIQSLTQCRHLGTCRPSGKTPTSQSEGPVSVPGQPMRDLRWTECH